MMKILAILLLLPSVVYAKKLSDYKHYDYDVLFTNPVCKNYYYKDEVYSNDGKLLKQRPKNAFCKQSDKQTSAKRRNSPQSKVLSWINSPRTKEIFMTFLSFSSREVRDALCKNIKERNLKLVMILDSKKEVPAANHILEKCQPASQSEYHQPEIYMRGHVQGIGWAHNKLIIVNPRAEEFIRLAFGSANMSSGLVLHHENWHFVKISTESFFAQSHLCLMEGMLDYATSSRKFKSYMSRCINDIDAPEEEDIKVSFVPGDGKIATQYIQDAIWSSDQVYMAAHRFSYTKLISTLTKKLNKHPDTRIRLIADDDLYWVNYEAEMDVPNTRSEYRKVNSLRKLGMDVRYMETNHWSRLLHHNKFLIFYKDKEPFAVHTGAGNLTGTAFTKNFENFYYITIPSVVKRFNNQYRYLWSLASSYGELPQENVKPK